MKSKKKVILMTIVSAVLFCSLIIVTSLSPLSDLGANANKFNTFGMWSAVGMILFFYILPLLLYMVGVNAMKFVMAVFCGFGIVIYLPVIPMVLVLGATKHIFPDLIGVMVTCFAGIIANIIWFYTAFRSSRRKKSVIPNI
ncbi:DUF5391 family protein [Heyndrickxia sp. NPDC080065]|uniref:DUF5391 family protein n=1 Tax=Heyndrickxia sp. NPDC080065 TaxID=3390568 RepID=UPI003D0286B0